MSFFAALFFLFSANAFAGPGQICLLNDTYCTSGSSSAKSTPAASSRVKINPSAVPTDDAFGIEMIGYKDQMDVGLAKGTGRIGAAISPANSEDTFFGALGLEDNIDALHRKQEKLKYPNQKTTLATAFNLYENKRDDIRHLSLNVGVMAKYNNKSKNTKGGAGLSAILGPVSLGFSAYHDEAALEHQETGSDLTPVTRLEVIPYTVQTYNVGLFLGSLIFDYSHLLISNEDPARIDLYTLSLLYKKFIFSASRRYENSARLKYDYPTKTLVDLRTNEEYFGGIQYRAHKRLMLGALYNYYLLREFSVTGTLFF